MLEPDKPPLEPAEEASELEELDAELHAEKGLVGETDATDEPADTEVAAASAGGGSVVLDRARKASAHVAYRLSGIVIKASMGRY